MNRPEVYKRSVDILYDAYFNDTLRERKCSACAVGNLIAANLGYKYGEDGFWSDRNGSYVSPEWTNVFYTVFKKQTTHARNYVGTAKEQIDSTGYSWEELAQIEREFEVAAAGFKKSEIKMFDGLSAVLEVLKEIHEVTDEDLIQSNSKRFKDHYERKLSIVR